MRRKKNLMILLSFCLGAAMFMTTAFADVVSKTGYDQLKDTMKYTLSNLEKGYDSFTVETAFSLKDNDKFLTSTTETMKFDMANKKKDSVNTTEFASGKKQNRYSYWDSRCYISYNPYDDIYYLNEYEKEVIDNVKFDNPLQEDRIQDIEKIFDAVVGNLKDHVIVEENTDGSKEFSGTVSDYQIPAVVNAFASYFFKQTVGGRTARTDDVPMPYLKEDVFIKKVSGRALVNKDGITENLFATFVLSGKDEDGTVHDLTLEAVFKFYNLNSTTVTKPDLAGKEVKKSTINNQPENFVTNKFLGKWKNDIIIEENDSFVKIGESIVEITSIDGYYVYGRYIESYKEEYADFSSDKKEFEFKVDITGNRGGKFEGTDSSGNKESGYIHFEPASINFHLDYKVPRGGTSKYSIIQYESTYNKVFEE